MNYFRTNSSFLLESGQELEELQIAYQTFGELNKEKSNVIWVCHALTGNTDVLKWWPNVFEGGTINPDNYFIICANNLGSCYGTTGPNTPLENHIPLYDEFPTTTTRDNAIAFDLLRSHLGIDKIEILIGASLGGQIALEWSILNSEVANQLILVASNAIHSPYGVAFNESQRLAIKSDRTFQSKNYNAGKNGLVAARSIALLSYRSYKAYNKTQDRANSYYESQPASSYQRYQGEKFAARFTAHSYYHLTKTMDSHNVARGRDSLSEALSRVNAKTLVIGISSDVLFPTEEQRYLSNNIKDALYTEVLSDFGHDGFLIETKQVKDLFEKFINGKITSKKLTVFKSTIKKNELTKILTNNKN